MEAPFDLLTGNAFSWQGVEKRGKEEMEDGVSAGTYSYCTF